MGRSPPTPLSSQGHNVISPGPLTARKQLLNMPLEQGGVGGRSPSPQHMTDYRLVLSCQAERLVALRCPTLQHCSVLTETCSLWTLALRQKSTLVCSSCFILRSQDLHAKNPPHKKCLGDPIHRVCTRHALALLGPYAC